MAEKHDKSTNVNSWCQKGKKTQTALVRAVMWGQRSEVKGEVDALSCSHVDQLRLLLRLWRAGGDGVCSWRNFDVEIFTCCWCRSLRGRELKLKLLWQTAVEINKRNKMCFYHYYQSSRFLSPRRVWSWRVSWQTASVWSSQLVSGTCRRGSSRCRLASCSVQTHKTSAAGTGVKLCLFLVWKTQELQERDTDLTLIRHLHHQPRHGGEDVVQLRVRSLNEEKHDRR